MSSKNPFIYLLLTLIISSMAFAQQSRNLAEEAFNAYEAKEYGKSCELFTAAIEKGSRTSGTYYNAACGCALAGKQDVAFQYLDSAIERGWTNLEHMEKDSDLDSLHKDSRWAAVVEKCRQKYEAYLKTLNVELLKMYREDQGDRSTDKIDWEVISKRDEQRRQRVKEMLAAGEVKTKDDYFHAAMIFQHGSIPADYETAHKLALKAAELDPNFTTAKWLSAASQDRYLWSIGKPQIYGTQFKMVDGKWTIDPIDTTALTDEEREKMGVPPLAESRKRAEEMNKRLDTK